MRSRVPPATFATTLALTMGAATFALVVFGVLANEIIGEFGIARWQVGALVTANALVGAVVSPWLGHVTDVIGARRATLGTLLLSAASLAFVATAGTFALLVVAAVLSGFAQALSNPATNKLISLHVQAGRRGVITGIKQSGVQFGTFLGGLMLPVIAALAGWRWSVGAFAALPALWVVVSWLTVPPDPGSDLPPGPPETQAIPPLIRRLALYGFLLGAGGTAIFTYLPLYGQEALGLSQTLTGTAVAVTGFVGIVARISWGRVAELRIGSVRALVIIAVLAAVSSVALLGAPVFGSGLLWIGAVMTGTSASAWNSVGMLAIIQALPARVAGRGSGIVLLGFLAGLGVGAPAFGWSVDLLGSYAPGWITVTILFLGAVPVIRRAEAVFH